MHWYVCFAKFVTLQISIIVTLKNKDNEINDLHLTPVDRLPIGHRFESYTADHIIFLGIQKEI